jgi:type VI secretion system protein ImpH
MAAESGRENVALSDDLKNDARRFDFFQAVRLLLRMARSPKRPTDASGLLGTDRGPVGLDLAPMQEIVRFRSTPSLTFPSTEVVEIRPGRPPANPLAPERPPELVASMMGLVGPVGVLPQHYTSYLISRIRELDRSFYEFLDVFNHRTISLYYRAWEKYRFPIEFERLQTSPIRGDEEDLFTFCLYSLVGLGTGGMRRRQEVDDETLLYYAGHFAHWPRNAVSLEEMLRDYFQLDFEVKQFQGQWLMLSEDDQSVLPSPAEPHGRNNQMGLNLIAGSRVWEVQSRIRLRVGPLSYRDFQRLMPSGDRLRRVGHFARTYVGPELDFDVQPVLLAAEVPWCRLGGDDDPSRLGWNTWVRSGEMPRDADDVIFDLEDV